MGRNDRQPIYRSARWKKLRKVQLARQPFCQYCTEHGRTELATVVDHVTPVRDAPDKAYDLDNLASLCRSCHDAKGKEERRGKRIGCDKDGVPLDGWE